MKEKVRLTKFQKEIHILCKDHELGEVIHTFELMKLLYLQGFETKNIFGAKDEDNSDWKKGEKG